MSVHLEELEKIARNPDVPTFENTIVEFDRCGRLFNRIEALFSNLTASETSPELQRVEREMAAPLAAHENHIYTHSALFNRIETIYAKRDQLTLNEEQRQLLQRIHLDFVRAGAKLSSADKRRYGEIMERLAVLSTQFSQNVLAAEANYQLVLESEGDLSGLPESLRTAAREAAKARGIDGYVITLSRSLVVPFLTFSKRRDLREKIFKAWTQRGDNPGPQDNYPVAAEILQLRQQQAELHGFTNFSDFQLADTMAGSQNAVQELLMKVWQPARQKAEAERNALQQEADKSGDRIQIAAWDWRYYAEKVRSSRYQLDEAEIKPYFSLERMVQAAFHCAYRLFGIRFTEIPNIKTYHPDVKFYEVHEGSKLIGLFLHDNFARPTKRGGAWMSVYRSQSRIDGEIIPIVVNNNNFAKGNPTLLSFDDARTLFHEFGHGLHGLLSNAHYERLAGTRVLRDFVELPSQLFEHWLSEDSILKTFARHYETDLPISDELIARLRRARTFNQGFENVEYVASALVDIALHARTHREPIDLVQFETDTLKKIGMPAEIVMRHRLPHFQHLFSGSSYASAYYVYLWAAVLDCDAFEAFTEAGDAFDVTLGKQLRTCIYASGATRPPMDAYRAFRGRDPDVRAMLAHRGLLGDS